MTGDAPSSSSTTSSPSPSWSHASSVDAPSLALLPRARGRFAPASWRPCHPIGFEKPHCCSHPAPEGCGPVVPQALAGGPHRRQPCARRALRPPHLSARGSLGSLASYDRRRALRSPSGRYGWTPVSLTPRRCTTCSPMRLPVHVEANRMFHAQTTASALGHRAQLVSPEHHPACFRLSASGFYDASAPRWLPFPSGNLSHVGSPALSGFRPLASPRHPLIGPRVRQTSDIVRQTTSLGSQPTVSPDVFPTGG